jgi:hypothetical protein
VETQIWTLLPDCVMDMRRIARPSMDRLSLSQWFCNSTCSKTDEIAALEFIFEFFALLKAFRLKKIMKIAKNKE